MRTGPWPSSRDYVEAIQNPRSCFDDPDLKTAHPALDRLGMPTVTSGQFAYVFKLNHSNGSKAQAVRCFRGSSDGREHRYKLVNDHLNKVSSPYSASFEYDSGGIKVRGQSWPTLVMEWIDGHALDSYLNQVYTKPEALKFLADMWLKVLQSLRDNHMAHGDLQHGNVIIDASTTLRLVDLDGMYVPAMSGWRAPELGHRHYQHPRRTATDFDEHLDNFSGLVIYLSLLALKESPSLWTKYHDENLIFVKRDFDDPRNSQAFKDIRALRGECARLAEALENACGAYPIKCPSVLDLAGAAPNRLPIWMTSSPVISVDRSTREVTPGTAPSGPAVQPSASSPGVNTAPPWWQQQQNTGASSTASRASSSPSANSVRAIAGSSAKNSVSIAFIGLFFSWAWYPLLNSLIIGMGATTASAGSLTIIAYLSACAALGFRMARSEAQNTIVRAATTSYAAPVPPIAPRVSTPVSGQKPGRPPGKGEVVGSSIRLIYHSPNCKWARKISLRNRVKFADPAIARSVGYRPCSVCSP